MLLGAAVREGAARGMRVEPVFSLYSYHGPVFRAMVRVTRSGAWPHKHYGFVGTCHVHGGGARAVSWRELGAALCTCFGRRAAAGSGRGERSGSGGGGGNGGGDDACSNGDGRDSSGGGGDSMDSSGRGRGRVANAAALSLSGPMWTGPLHDASALCAIRAEAEARGWLGHDFGIDSPHAGGVPGSTSNSGARAAAAPPASPRLSRSKKNAPRALGELLDVMLEEAEPRLPPGFLPLASVAKHVSASPARDKLLFALRARGHAAGRCHLDARAIRTDAPMVDVVDVCVDALGLSVREHSPFAAPLLRLRRRRARGEGKPEKDGESVRNAI
eukprot:156595-Chlamydomonas_euryale.AAC.1